MFVVGICGGVASGKTTLSKRLSSLITNANVLSLDNYFYPFSELDLEERKQIDFDNPNVYDYDLIVRHIKLLKSDRCIEMPIYSFKDYTRSNETKKIKPSKVLIVEGYTALYNESLRQLYDYMIFVDVDEKTQLDRLIKRDIKERARDKQSVIEHFYKKIKASNINYVLPQKKFADLIVSIRDIK